jgi:hypothetical protein
MTKAQLSQKKGLTEIVLDFFKNGKEVPKTIAYTCNWLVELFPPMPSPVHELATGMKNAKNFFSFLALPEKIVKFSDAASTLFSDAAAVTVQKVRNFVKESTGLFNAFSDTTELAAQFFPVGKDLLKSVKTLNLGATFLGAGNSAAENIQKLSNTKSDEDQKRTLYLINTARDVSYFVFASYMLGSMAMGAAVTSMVVLGLLTSGLVFTIGGFFYERMVDPEKKGMNIPEAVVAHFKREAAVRSPTARA